MHWPNAVDIPQLMEVDVDVPFAPPLLSDGVSPHSG